MKWHILFLISALAVWYISFMIALFGGANSAFSWLAFVGFGLSFGILAKNRVVVALVLAYSLIGAWLPIRDCFGSIHNALSRELTSSAGDWQGAAISGVPVLVLFLSSWFILRTTLRRDFAT